MLPGEKVNVLEQTFNSPGVHSLLIKCPDFPTHAAVRIDMLDQHKFHYSDEFSLSFHIHYYRIFKWILALPLFVMLFVLTFTKAKPETKEVSLPSFRQV